MKLVSSKYIPQNECEMSRNLNRTDGDDSNKRYSITGLSGSNKCEGERVAVSGWDQTINDINHLWKGKQKARIKYRPIDPFP